MSWRVLVWFWVALAAVAVTGAALLQILGPPLSISERATESAASQQVASFERAAAPAASVDESQPANDAGSAPLADPQTEKVAQDRLQPAPEDNAVQNFREASTPA